MINFAPSGDGAVAELSATAVLTDEPASAILPRPIGPIPVQDRSDLIDNAYDNYCRLREAGGEVDPDEFCSRFPAFQTSLRRLLQAHRELEDNPDVFHGLGTRWPEPGEEFLGYSLISELGRGAFARVFLARERNVGARQVAVKLSLHPTNEADTLGRLRHPGVVPIYSAHFDPGTGFSVVVMPFLGGSTLCHVLDHLGDRGRPDRATVLLEAAHDVRWPGDPAAPPDAVLRRGRFLDGVVHLGTQLADALAAVHAQGYLHRDLKPSNVLLCPNGRPVLLDFNLALDQDVPEYRLGGTLPYMPPEQLAAMARGRGKQPVQADARVDVFGLGVLIYELLAGVHPFGPVPLKLKSNEVREFLLDRQQRGPRPLSDLQPSTDPSLDRLLSRCLAWDPAERPATARELAGEFRKLLSPSRRARRWVGRHVRSLAACAALAAVPAGYGMHALATLPPAAVRYAANGASLFGDGQYEEAAAAFTAALDADRDNKDLLFKRARALQKAGRVTEALKDFQNASLAADAKAIACRGYCLSHEDGSVNHEAALACYREAIQRGFTAAALHNDMAYSLVQLGRFADAEACANTALARDLGLRAAYCNRAMAQLQRACMSSSTELGTALDDFRVVLSRGPVGATEYAWAARATAQYVRLQRKPDGAPERNEAVRYLTEAIKNGYPLKDLMNCPFVSRANLPTDWQQVQPEVPAAIVTPSQDRLVDPLLGTGE